MGARTMKRYTEKYVRRAGMWVKITRDNVDRTFFFARGYEGEYQAHDKQLLPFKWVANWDEALQYADRMIETYQ